jgi:malate/lactate dehydrogenase
MCSTCALQAAGATKIHPVGNLSAFEKANFDKMLPELKAAIEKGVKFAQTWKSA